MKGVIFFIFIFTFNSYAYVYGGYDKNLDCNYLSVHWTDSTTNQLTPTVPDGGEKLYYTTIFGRQRAYDDLATKHLSIDFETKQATMQLEYTVAFGINQNAKKIYINSENPNFSRLINTLNVKPFNVSKSTIQYICFKDDGEVVDLKFLSDLKQK